MSTSRFIQTSGASSTRWTIPLSNRFNIPSTRLIRPDKENTPDSSSILRQTGTDSKTIFYHAFHSHSFQRRSFKPGFVSRTVGTTRLFCIFRFPSYPIHFCNHSTSFSKLSRSIHSSSISRGPNPYEILGIARDASANDLKKRYRELAKKYHPDLNPGPEASEKMAAISSAYQLLSDPKQRDFYDQTGMSAEEAGVNPDQAHSNPFQGGFSGVDPSFMFTDFTSFFTDAFNGRAGGHVLKGEDIATEVSLDFLEAAKGCRKEVHLQTNASCGDCSGTGCTPGTSMSTCRSCSGTGTQKIERGPIIFGTVCSRCNGSGQIVSNPCKSCKGSGVRSRPRGLDLDFPAGIRTGMELRISGQGHAGARGGRSGDLFVKVHVKPHPQFKLVQNDIHVTIPLTWKQCLLGGEVQVPTLDGKLKLTVPPMTSPGEVKLLRGKGIKKVHERGYGDIAVHWGIEMPETLTERQKQLVNEFDNICNRKASATENVKASIGTHGINQGATIVSTHSSDSQTSSEHGEVNVGQANRGRVNGTQGNGAPKPPKPESFRNPIVSGMHKQSKQNDSKSRSRDEIENEETYKEKSSYRCDGLHRSSNNSNELPPFPNTPSPFIKMSCTSDPDVDNIEKSSPQNIDESSQISTSNSKSEIEGERSGSEKSKNSKCSATSWFNRKIGKLRN